MLKLLVQITKTINIIPSLRKCGILFRVDSRPPFFCHFGVRYNVPVIILDGMDQAKTNLPYFPMVLKSTQNL